MENLKVGIAGLGRIGKIHLNNLLQMQNVDISAAMDPDEEAQKYAKSKGVKLVFKTYKELLNVHEIKALIICTPTDTHADYVELAALAGKHVFCEKPLDLNIKRVIEVLEIIKKTKIKLMIGFNRRFDKEFYRVKKRILNGDIGDPHLVKITSRDPSPPPLSYIKHSGGLFLDMSVHDFDMARFIVEKEVEEVYARGAVLTDKKISEVGDIDTAVIILKYTDSSMAVIDNSRKASYGYDQRLEVFGSKGMLQGNNIFQDNHSFYNEKGVESSLPMNFFLERYAEAYIFEIKSFIDSLINNSIVSVNGKDGLESLRIGLAAKKSLQENRPVKLNEIET